MILKYLHDPYGFVFILFISYLSCVHCESRKIKICYYNHETQERIFENTYNTAAPRTRLSFDYSLLVNYLFYVDRRVVGTARK